MFKSEYFFKIDKGKLNVIHKNTAINLDYKNLKNKKINIVLEGEQIYIKSMYFPKVSHNKLSFLIERELTTVFNSLENILYSYEILKTNKNNIYVTIFCLNIKKEKTIYPYLSKYKHVEGVYPVQLMLMNFYKSKIKDKNYIIIIKHNNYIYLLYVLNKFVKLSKVVHEDQNLSNGVKEFISEIKDKNFILYNVIYCVNFKLTNELSKTIDDFKIILINEIPKLHSIKNNFIPCIYKRKANKIYLLKLTVCILALMVIFKNLWCLNLEYNKNLDVIKNNIKQIKQKQNINFAKGEENSDKILKDFSSIYNILNKNIYVNKFEIGEGKVIIAGECIEEEGYYNFVKSIESIEGFNILNIISPTFKNENYNFEIVIKT